MSIGGGKAAAYPVWSDSKVTFQLGSAAATGNITVTTSGGASNGVPFTVRSGNIYFVSTSGNDSANGSYSAPWKTLLKARNTMAAGDTVYALNGVGQTADDGQGWGAALTLRNTWCSSSNPRAMVAYPGATVTIGTVNGPSSGIRSTDSSAGEGACVGGWVFAGLQLRGASEAAGLAGPSNNWRFVGNDMTCPNGDGQDACFHTTQVSTVDFYGNSVHDTGTANASAEYHGVYFSTDSNHIDLGWNTIANVHGGRGVQFYSTPIGSGTGYNQYDIHIHDNIIHDTQCDGIVLATVDPSKGPVEAYNNVIYNAGEGPANPENTGNWSCIFSPGTTNTGAAGSGAVQVYGNTMYNCGGWTSQPYGGANGAVNNGGNSPSMNIRNNLIYQEGSEPYVVGGGITGSNNLFYGTGSAPSGFTASLNSNPLLVNTPQYDFQLTSSSPAACAGTATPQTADFAGVSLPQCSAYPIGAYAYASSSGNPSVSVSVSPATLSLPAGGAQQFTATVSGSSNTAVTWAMNPIFGTLSASGLYTAPSGATSQEIVTITATSAADSTKSASATVTVAPTPVISVSLNPASISLNASQTQQFTATVSNTSNTAVAWTISPSVGTISAAGMYTAPSSITTQQTVTVTATSSADSSKSARATVTLNPTAVISVGLNPASVSLNASQTQQFTATCNNTSNKAVTWSISPSMGTVSASGMYAAPSSVTTQQTVTVTATSSADTTKTAKATVTLNPTAAVSVAVSPASVSLNASQTQQFTATVSNTTNTAVAWTISPSVGTISTSGLYTAPSSVTTQQTVTVTATSKADTTKSGRATVTVMPTVAVSVGLSPASVSLKASQSQQFRATVSNTSKTGVTWSISPAVGTMSATGLYTAPSSITTQRTVTVTATSIAASTKTAKATVTLVRSYSHSGH